MIQDFKLRRLQRKSAANYLSTNVGSARKIIHCRLLMINGEQMKQQSEKCFFR